MEDPGVEPSALRADSPKQSGATTPVIACTPNSTADQLKYHPATSKKTGSVLL
jgi:hypothetical protein